MKQRLHPRNKHNGQYDFDKLVDVNPNLKKLTFVNKYGTTTIDFSNNQSVLELNRALLSKYYSIKNWDIPEGFLCPPIPGRVDYMHHLSDYLARFNNGKVPKGINIRGLDIGVGANCIYPLVANAEYGWNMVGSDISKESFNSANTIVKENQLSDVIELRFQDTERIFRGIIKDEFFDLTVCNPPFHSSREDAQKGSIRKERNLSKNKVERPTLNFGGQHNELWCEGGELRFIQSMIQESKVFGTNVFCFSTLVSKESNLKSIYKALNKAEVTNSTTIEMGQGNKVSRIVVWSFLSEKQKKKWINARW